ncbi:hypothetical protein PWT90_02030 [Aphanocladium album]|nr:hypothetical protein PWT90_02030 [Aphanocladium album]
MVGHATNSSTQSTPWLQLDTSKLDSKNLSREKLIRKITAVIQCPSPDNNTSKLEGLFAQMETLSKSGVAPLIPAREERVVSIEVQELGREAAKQVEKHNACLMRAVEKPVASYLRLMGDVSPKPEPETLKLASEKLLKVEKKYCEPQDPCLPPENDCGGSCLLNLNEHPPELQRTLQRIVQWFSAVTMMLLALICDVEKCVVDQFYLYLWETMRALVKQSMKEGGQIILDRWRQEVANGSTDPRQTSQQPPLGTLEVVPATSRPRRFSFSGRSGMRRLPTVWRAFLRRLGRGKS